MRDILPTLERWSREGTRAAVATVVSVERSAPRVPGSSMAVAETGEIAGSVTGGCVEPAVHAEAQEVLAGGPPRMARFGIVDDDAFAIGLPCGGQVGIFVEPLDPALTLALAEAVAAERPVAYVTTVDGPGLGSRHLVGRDPDGEPEVERMLTEGRTGLIDVGDDRLFVSSFVPRPEMYVFGAIDFASALAHVGRFLGYRVTVCDARAAFVTRERFPDADELVVAWPHELLAERTLDERAAVCVLTHDEKFDVPALKAALRTPAGYIGAMGSRRTTERRAARLREEGVDADGLTRIHAPIGLPIGSSTPEEVAIAIGAQIISTARVTTKEVAREARARV
jgi:xanthine dehydrogenase accessory factor